MQIAHTRAELDTALAAARRRGNTVGFVPTMGALHAGHLALVERALAACDTVVASVFVNPLQFNAAADFDAYPQRLAQDANLLRVAGCQVLFAPPLAEMYPAPAVIQMHFGALEATLEGAMRPGHFSGVGLVVAKLFNMVRPAKAYFGQKDMQQVAVVRRLVSDLSFGIEILAVPTKRAESGLALSSRNERLSPVGLAKAPRLYDALQMAAALMPLVGAAGACSSAKSHIEEDPSFEVEYLRAVHPDTFEDVVDGMPGPIAICVAAWLEGVRLIDNVMM